MLLSEILLALVGELAGDVDALAGSTASETEVIHGALCWAFDSVLKWVPRDFDTHEARVGGLESGFICLQADWWTTFGLDQASVFDHFQSWLRALRKECAPEADAHTWQVSPLLEALIVRHAAELDSAALEHQHCGFASIVEALARSLLRWDVSHLLCDDIAELDEPVALVGFSFGTGQKLGEALRTPTLVGPGLEAPGATNCGLAAAIRGILKRRPMPVFAQWEIADALLHGPGGAPTASSYARWVFDDAGADGYALSETIQAHAEEGAGEVVVRKAVPSWPAALQSGELAPADLGKPLVMWKYYMGTPDVIDTFRSCWSEGPAPPRSFLLVGHHDHVARCVTLMGAPAGTKVAIAGKSMMPAASEWAVYGCDEFGFDSSSSQPWTRNRAMFLAREMLCRCGGVFLDVYTAEPTDGGHHLRFVGVPAADVALGAEDG